MNMKKQIIAVAVLSALALALPPAAFAGSAGVVPISPLALPAGPQAISGGISSVSTSANSMSVDLSGNKNGNAAVVWKAGFDIGSAAFVTENLAGTDAGTHAILNIDASGNPSQINGSMLSNANVWLANGNGVIFGPNANFVDMAPISGGFGVIVGSVQNFDYAASTPLIAYKASGAVEGAISGSGPAAEPFTMIVSGSSVVNTGYVPNVNLFSQLPNSQYDVNVFNAASIISEQNNPPILATMYNPPLTGPRF